jgi:hypothetical protein
MSDDLVKRAMHNAMADMPHYASVELIEVMAHRIEELEERLKAATDDANEAETYVAEMEAKLANAMKTLEFYADGEWPQDYPGGVLYASGDDTPEFKTHLDYGDKARTTLAELKGEK